MRDPCWLRGPAVVQAGAKAAAAAVAAMPLPGSVAAYAAVREQQISSKQSLLRVHAGLPVCCCGFLAWLAAMGIGGVFCPAL